MGGFVYVNEGLVDFVQSDDELASVIGHETGHIERRHVITTNSKAEILNLLFGIASIFSPIIYEFGGLAEAGLMAKIERGRRTPGRPLRLATDVARRLRPRIDGHDDGASGSPARRAQRRRQQVSGRPSRPVGARRAPHGLSGARSHDRDGHARAGSGLERRGTRALLDFARAAARPSPGEGSAESRSAARARTIGAGARPSQ